MSSTAKQFWNWFIKNQEDYKNINKNTSDLKKVEKLLDAIVVELQKYSDGLYVEIGGNDIPHELIITAQGRKNYFAAAELLVKEAPEIKDWKIFALKPSHGSDFSFEMNGIKINPNTVFFKPLEDENDKDAIGICIYHAEYDPEDEEKRNALINAFYYVLDSVLGEASTSLDVSFMEFAQLTNAKEDGIVPISELASYITWKKKERESDGVEFPKEDVALLKAEIDGKPVMLLANRNYKYYNYTKNYPYLLNIELQYNEVSDDGMPTENVEPIYDIEDALIETATSTKNGHYIASQSYDGKRTLFFYMKTDNDRQELIKKAQSVITTHEHACYADYDPYWLSVEPFLY